MAKQSDNILEISQSKSDPPWLAPENLPRDGSFLDVAGARIRGVKEFEETSAATAKAIKADAHLSDIGRTEKLAERGAGVLAQHKALTKDIDDVLPALAATAKAAMAKPEISEIGQFMAMSMEQEIRRDLKDEFGSDAMLLEGRIREAEANGDVVLLDAVLNGHASSPLQFDRAAVTAMRDGLAGGGATLIDEALADVRARLDWAEQSIRDDFGIGKEDNLTVIANADVKATG